MTDPAVEAAFAKLLRGLGHGSRKISYSAHRELFQMGAAIVPALERRIFQSDWKILERPGAVRLLAGLVNLLHDIDEDRSREVIEHLIRNGCHPVAKSVLRSIQRFSRENFRVYEANGIEIFESKDIDEQERVPHYLRQWIANIPPEDLAGIERINVVSLQLDTERTSHYVPNLAAITLVWQNSAESWKPFAALVRMTNEKTLYHEIGHHAFKHEPGQIPDQEKEANHYAQRVLEAVHPNFSRSRPLFSVIRWLLRFVLRQISSRTR